MRPLKILIVDDEPPARAKVRTFTTRELPEAAIREAENGLQAVEMIRRDTPDLVFLDIQMPGMNGFELIDLIGPREMPLVIFVTAYDQYALAAFEVQALDYLLKPFDADRFHNALDRARRKLEGPPLNPAWQERLKDLLNNRPPLERLLIHSGDRYFFVPCRDITHLTAEEKYVRIHTSAAQHLLRQTMNQLEQRLDPQRFVRVHRSTIVNLDAIKEIQPWAHGDCRIVLRSGIELMLSRRYRDRVLKS